jgi:hypothetical protein
MGDILLLTMFSCLQLAACRVVTINMDTATNPTNACKFQDSHFIFLSKPSLRVRNTFQAANIAEET